MNVSGQRPLLVVGAGIAGITAALETAEAGNEAVLVEREPAIGGRVLRSHQYFPKLCPPSCGMEMNVRRVEKNPRIRVLTGARVAKAVRSANGWAVTIAVSPRFVNERCTVCGECAKVCPAEVPDPFNLGMSTTAIRLPHPDAWPRRFVRAPDPLLQPADWQQKETIKAAYADGREYFLVSGGMYHDTLLLNLLKAFSQFKKWQHSNMKLIITGTVSKQHAGLAEKLATYKYREDVVLTGLLPAAVNTRLITAAYALVHTTAPCASELIMLDAMQAGIPVIAEENNNLPETGGDAVLYADPANPETIGKQMLALYKDENLRGQYIEKGKEKAAQFSWATTAAAFWQLLVS